MKTTKLLVIFSAMGLGLAGVGCDSTSGCTDAGVCPDLGAGGGSSGHGGTTGAGGAGGAAAPLYGVTEGTYCFDITGGTVASDGCGFTPAAEIGSRKPVTYNATTGIISVGRMGSLGAGPIDKNQGTLTRDGDTADEMMPTCTWHQTDTSLLQLTATNTFTVSVTETESNFALACVPPPPSDPCTSTFSYTMVIHSPALMPDAVTGKCP
jgi:hypothetical protein